MELLFIAYYGFGWWSALAWFLTLSSCYLAHAYRFKGWFASAALLTAAWFAFIFFLVQFEAKSPCQPQPRCQDGYGFLALIAASVVFWALSFGLVIAPHKKDPEIGHEGIIDFSKQ